MIHFDTICGYFGTKYGYFGTKGFVYTKFIWSCIKTVGVNFSKRKKKLLLNNFISNSMEWSHQHSLKSLNSDNAPAKSWKSIEAGSTWGLVNWIWDGITNFWGICHRIWWTPGLMWGMLANFRTIRHIFRVFVRMLIHCLHKNFKTDVIALKIWHA